MLKVLCVFVTMVFSGGYLQVAITENHIDSENIVVSLAVYISSVVASLAFGWSAAKLDDRRLRKFYKLQNEFNEFKRIMAECGMIPKDEK